jgi:Flp pilus assembly protein TadD
VSLDYYADWLEAARAGDTVVAAELRRLNQWATDWVTKWYGDRPRPHFASALGAAWRQQEGSEAGLTEVAQSRDETAIARASALWQLYLQAPGRAVPVATRLLSHRHPQLRAVAIRCLTELPPERLVPLVAPRLTDPVRLVRQEAAQRLADVPRQRLKLADQQALVRALDEYQAAQRLHPDLAGAHTMLGVLAERMNNPQQAIRAYELAMHVQPSVTGPRSNLAGLYDRLGNPAAAAKLRQQELVLMERDVRLAPTHAALQYRYGLLLYLNDQSEAAVSALERACELEPHVADYHLALALLLERLERWEAAWQRMQTVRALRPADPSIGPILTRLRARGQPGS